MNKLFTTSTKWAALFVAVFGIMVMNSCTEEPVEPPVLVEDGFYVSGSATAYEGLSINATLSTTRNEVLQENRASLLETYLPLKSGESFNIVEVAGDLQTTWGPAGDFADVLGGENEQPNVGFQRGGITQTDDAFTVPTDGLYHIVIDTEVGIAAIVPVTYWGIIGGATPNGWSGDTELNSLGFGTSSMTYQATDIPLTLGDYKFRYSGGWKLEIDPNYDLGDGNTGIKVNCNFGEALDALVPGGANISNAESGYYTVTVVWTEGAGITASLEKTGDLAAFDWSSTELGLVGDGVIIDGTAHNWDSTALLQVPLIDGTTYSWSFNNIGVIAASGGFKIREGQDWSGTILGFNEVTLAGDGAGDFETNGDGNFIPLSDGATYNFTLTIDAATETYTFTAEIQ